MGTSAPIVKHMLYNYRLFFRQFFHSLFFSKNTHARFTTKRLRFTIVFLFLYPGVWLATTMGFLFDHLFFPGFRKQEVEKPVFIMGNFRSGSTMLHRLLAEDTQNFSVIKSWEIYSSPSICQRKLVRGLKIVDSWFGSPFYRRLADWNRKELQQIKIHKTGIHEPEEDEGLFFYNWYSLFVWFFFPILIDEAPYHRFDQEVSEPVKKRLMRFYKRCIQRHIYAHGGKTHYLTKNPSMTGRLDALLRFFPDAKIVYLIRNPVEAISSQISWFSFAWNYFADPLEKYPFTDVLLEMARYWYRYPLKRLNREPSYRYAVIRFDDLVFDLEETVRGLYKKFSFPITKSFEWNLQKASRAAKAFKSKHYHSLEEAHISEIEIIREFEDIFLAYTFRKC